MGIVLLLLLGVSAQRVQIHFMHADLIPPNSD